EALVIRISQKFALLKEVRHVIEIMAYHDKYKKVLDEILKDRVELDGKIIKEEEEAIKRIKGGVLKEKDDLRAFIFPIRLEGKVNENALADTGSNINTMPYRIYETLGREEMKKVDRGITMINYTQAKAMGMFTNVLCQVGVTTIIAKFLIQDIPLDRDAPIVVGRGFLYTIGSILNTPEKLFSTFDGICHQTFRAARFDVLRTAKSDSDDEEEYRIKRNKFGAPIYGQKPVPYLNYNDSAERSLALQATMGTHDDEAESSRSKRSRQHETVEEVLLPQGHHEFLLWEGCNRDAKSRMSYDEEIDDMLRIMLREAGSNEEIFTFVAWIRASNINEPIYAELCHEFYSTYEFDEVCADDELQTKKIIKFRLGGHPGIPDGQVTQKPIPNTAAFQTDNLDAYDSDCDDVSNAKGVLMANLSIYGSGFISEKLFDVELNQLSEDFGKCFVPQQELSDEQTFWLQISHPNTDQFASSPVKIEAPRELLKASLVNTSLKKLKYHLSQFDIVVKKRITPDVIT
nr:hypothetical protein [Tanacetum cinerariifolium]